MKIIYHILFALLMLTVIHFGGIGIRGIMDHLSFEQHRKDLLSMTGRDNLKPEDIRHIPSHHLSSFYAALERGQDRDRRWWQW